jgi:hypothetical protein
MGYGVILKLLETWVFFPKNFLKRGGVLMAFSAGKRGGCTFLTGMENTRLIVKVCH